jgi:hypothetical protein
MRLKNAGPLAMVCERRDGENLLINGEDGGSERTKGTTLMRVGSVLRTMAWAQTAEVRAKNANVLRALLLSAVYLVTYDDSKRVATGSEFFSSNPM